MNQMGVTIYVELFAAFSNICWKKRAAESSPCVITYHVMKQHKWTGLCRICSKEMMPVKRSIPDRIQAVKPTVVWYTLG